jgi:uncharacterized protein YbjT (DUF2867 family)
MTAPILVTGGTGTLGRRVVPLLRAAGRDVRVLSRRDRAPEPGVTYVTGDLRADEGVERAVDGVRTILHLAGGPKGDDEAARHLLRAAARADVGHIVHISVIGADAVPLGFLRAKLAAEQAVAGSGVPFTVLRAAQFHEFVLGLVEKLAAPPVVPVPGMRVQPVDARDVAGRLVDLALAEPAGRVPDLAGPREYELKDVVRSYLAARGRRRPLVGVRIPGKAGRSYRAGANLTLDGTRGTRTWEDFLAERTSAGEGVQPREFVRRQGE